MSHLFILGPKYWSFSFSISPSNEYSGLISFRVDWFDLLTLKSLLQHHNLNLKASILWHSAFFMIQLSHLYMIPGKSFDYTDLLEKSLAAHSSILAWSIQWTEKPGGLQSQRVGHNWSSSAWHGTAWHTMTFSVCWKQLLKIVSVGWIANGTSLGTADIGSLAQPVGFSPRVPPGTGRGKAGWGGVGGWEGCASGGFPPTMILAEGGNSSHCWNSIQTCPPHLF